MHADTVVLAILFHDLLYHNHADQTALSKAAFSSLSLDDSELEHIFSNPSNEKQSSAAFQLFAEALRISQDTTARVSRLIMLTEHTSKFDGVLSSDEAYFLDCDLSILGADPEAYRNYVRGVRVEYGFVSESDWKKGRSAVLRQLSAQGSVFRTQLFIDMCGRLCAHNIEAELNELA